MTYINYQDVIDQLRAAGLQIDDIIVDGKVHPCRTDEDHGKSKKGWYVCHELRIQSGETVIVGAFGNWREGVDSSGKPVAHRIALNQQTITPEERAAITKRIAENRRQAEAMRQRNAEKAAKAASAAWKTMAVEGRCDYLARKGLSGPHGAKFSAKGNLVIPLQDPAGNIHGLQIIYGDPEEKKKRGRDKDFWPAGLAKRGHFFLIGAPGPIILIAEGFATAASIHESTLLPVVVAFDAGNLMPVAEHIKKRWRAKILICADDDFQTAGNPGITAASRAALAVNGAMVVPFFEDRGEHKWTDFNDLAVTSGTAVVRGQIEHKLSELGWRGDMRGTAQSGEAGPPDTLKPITTVDELLQRFSLIYGHGETVFDHFRCKIVSLSDMRNLCNQRQLARDWQASLDRKVVEIENVGFDPAGSDPKITCNLWSGWPTKPKPGSCDTLLELAWYLCSGEDNTDEVYRWLLCWLAYPLQHPGAKMKTAVVMHGPQGAGKNLFFESIMAIYGQYAFVVDQSAIEDKFNDWASKKLFLIADEVVARQELFHVKNKLKHFITGDQIRINPKNFGAYWERNHVNIVFLSNETQPLVLERDDRRHTVIWTPEKLPKDFYTDVHTEIKEGGIAALHDYLLNLDLGDFKPYTEPPRTKSKEELQEISMDSTDRFWLEWTGGRIDGIPVVPCRSEDLYQLYRQWCGHVGIPRHAAQHILMSKIGKRPDARKEIARYWCGTQTKQATFVFPLSAEKPPAEDQKSWITRCAEQFVVGLKDWREACHA